MAARGRRDVIALLKGLHVAALLPWCAGLVALPLLLARHSPHHGQPTYARLRRMTHYGYVAIVTPCAVVAVGSGTGLIFAREVFEPWLFAKLAAVGAMVVVHAWIGHVVVRAGETAGRYRVPAAWPTLLALGIAISSILTLVLAKPRIDADALPAWLAEPRAAQDPVDAVPRP